MNEQAITKLLLSSLFARKMKYLVTTEDPNQWIYSTMSPDDVMMYRPNSIHVIHLVTFKLPIHKTIIEQLPMLDVKNVAFNLKTLNRLVDDKVKFETSSNTNTGDILVKINNGEEEQLGRHIDTMIIEGYLNLVSIPTLKDNEDTNEVAINVDDTCKNQIGFLDIFTKPLSSVSSILGKLRIPYIEGHDFVSRSEYVKKIDDTEVSLKTITWRDNHVYRNYYQYEDSSMKVITRSPSVVYFPITIDDKGSIVTT